VPTLLLAVERLEQSMADLGRIVRQVVEPVAVLAWQARRRDVEVAVEVDGHRAVEHAAHRLDVRSLRAPGQPFQRLCTALQ
jgi:hypothetical protein